MADARLPARPRPRSGEVTSSAPCLRFWRRALSLGAANDDEGRNPHPHQEGRPRPGLPYVALQLAKFARYQEKPSEAISHVIVASAAPGSTSRQSGRAPLGP